MLQITAIVILACILASVSGRPIYCPSSQSALRKCGDSQSHFDQAQLGGPQALVGREGDLGERNEFWEEEAEPTRKEDQEKRSQFWKVEAEPKREDLDKRAFWMKETEPKKGDHRIEGRMLWLAESEPTKESLED
ncbi:hypothetical protein B0H10DRAFT_1937894 [Mycena sp. CBHHK59/15]|nr:hypothetical protein B0H10DRAFT_1937894 [Mycena sp. CBHHK59/15]